MQDQVALSVQAMERLCDAFPDGLQLFRRFSKQLPHALKSAAPDGYTIVMTTGANMAINPSLYRKLPYDSVADFEPIVTVVSSPLFMFTASATKIASARDIPAYVSANGAQVAYGSNGNGGTPHIAMEMFKKAANLDMLHVPYKGTPPLITDVIGGQVVFAFDAGPSILPLVRDGRVKLLGVSSAQRTIVAPDMPTLAEQGFSGFSAVTWAAVYAPKGTPALIGFEFGSKGRADHA